MEIGYATCVTKEETGMWRTVGQAWLTVFVTKRSTDNYAFNLATMPSLRDLNTQLSKPVEMIRFRPNFVIDGDFDAWDEVLYDSQYYSNPGIL